MKIVNRETFLEMPRGTVFRKWEPNAYEEVNILLGKVGENDFNYYSLEGECDKGEHYEYGIGDKGKIPNMENIEVVFSQEESYRDGCFDIDTMYAIYEKGEIEKIISMLQDCIL